MPQAMTVGELFEHLAEVDPQTKIVVSKDAEGNEYSGLSGYSLANADASWTGERTDSIADPEDEDRDPEQDVQDVIVLWRY